MRRKGLVCPANLSRGSLLLRRGLRRGRGSGMQAPGPPSSICKVRDQNNARCAHSYPTSTGRSLRPAVLSDTWLITRYVSLLVICVSPVGVYCLVHSCIYSALCLSIYTAWLLISGPTLPVLGRSVVLANTRSLRFSSPVLRVYRAFLETFWGVFYCFS